MRKVKLEILKPWIATRFTELNGIEDDIVSSMVIGLLEDKDNVVSHYFSLMTPFLPYCVIC
jgi:serine/arginine repetitive matrix protein 1